MRALLILVPLVTMGCSNSSGGGGTDGGGGAGGGGQPASAITLQDVTAQVGDDAPHAVGPQSSDSPSPPGNMGSAPRDPSQTRPPMRPRNAPAISPISKSKPTRAAVVPPMAPPMNREIIILPPKNSRRGSL